MIIVYFESKTCHYAEEVARFRDEETYNLCWSTLYKEAKECNMKITDSLIGEGEYPFTSEEINKNV
tara:strand:- start:655 stop:852 length:198 start_codon:yes stop_codon:yes gene_type:complete